MLRNDIERVSIPLLLVCSVKGRSSMVLTSEVGRRMFIHPNPLHTFSRLDISSPSACKLDIEELLACIVQTWKDVAEE